MTIDPVKQSEDMRRIIEVAHKHGWDGVNNSKILWVFLDEELTEKARLKDHAEQPSGCVEIRTSEIAKMARNSIRPLRRIHPRMRIKESRDGGCATNGLSGDKRRMDDRDLLIG